MAFADPQTVTISGAATTLPRVGSGPSTGAFAAPDTVVRLGISHQYGKRTRRQARIDLNKIAPDPLISSTNIRYSASAYVVVDVPITGFSIAEQKGLVDALSAWLATGTGAANNSTKLLGGEN